MEGETFQIYAEDAKDFYYLFRWPEARWDENIIGPGLTAAQLLQAGAKTRRDELAAFGDKPLDAVLVAPGMDDQKAAELAE